MVVGLTKYNTNKKVYLNVKDITKVVDGHDLVGNRGFSWTDVSVYDNQTGKESVIHVIESARLIGQLIREAMTKIKEDKA